MEQHTSLIAKEERALKEVIEEICEIVNVPISLEVIIEISFYDSFLNFF